MSSEDAPLSVDEAMRRFQAAVTDARRAQLTWIESIGPPPGWKKLGPEDLRPPEMDSAYKEGNTRPMNDITREEFNARMETIEVKMDARVESVSAKIDGFLAVQAERDKRLDESIANIRGDIARLGSLKLNIWGAMLTAVGIGIAVAALSVTFYQTGKADKPEPPPAAITSPTK
jgi:hypothetical protein